MLPWPSLLGADFWPTLPFYVFTFFSSNHIEGRGMVYIQKACQKGFLVVHRAGGVGDQVGEIINTERGGGGEGAKKTYLSNGSWENGPFQ